MSVWDNYTDRISARGGTKQNAALVREQRMIWNKLPDNLSFTDVVIYPREHTCNITSEESLVYSYTQPVAIINSDNLNEKTMISMPEHDIESGSLLYWMDNYWVVSERDANTTLYTKTYLLQCNHILRWIEDGEIMEQWCIIEDGTKYLTGELEDRNFFTTRGDSRIGMEISRNSYTVKFDREMRFLIDDEDSPHKLSYALTKPLKLGSVYNGTGTFNFVLQEVTATEYDNHELGVADYYRYFPKNTIEESESDDTADETDAAATAAKEVWL